jgi:Ca2+-binding RTX toxin-like protein
MKLLITLAVMSALLLVPSDPGVAAPPTCQGRPATLVGKPGGTVGGTAGADVVITNGASRVDTSDGDDVVCVTGARGKRVFMDTGPGNDRVRVTGRDAVKVFLGDGDDSFVGGRENDVVFAGYPDSYDYSPIDTGTDTIRTGAGEDLVRSYGGADSLSLGKGNDVLLWAGRGGVVDGGRGTNTMDVGAFRLPGEDPVSWLLDNVREQLLLNGVSIFSWSHFTGFEVGTSPGEPLVVRGSAADETFEVPGFDGRTIRAGGGDDMVVGGRGDDTLVGGPGRDEANGRSGDDRCVAEVREDCERR